jgi:hypothetical protein
MQAAIDRRLDATRLEPAAGACPAHHRRGPLSSPGGVHCIHDSIKWYPKDDELSRQFPTATEAARSGFVMQGIFGAGLAVSSVALSLYRPRIKAKRE